MTMNSVKQYRVIFSDGTTKVVHGRYDAHAWAVARNLWPDKCVRSLEREAEKVDAVS